VIVTHIDIEQVFVERAAYFYQYD